MATTADEPARTSTWQLLFGTNKKHSTPSNLRRNNQEEDYPQPPDHTVDSEPQSHSPNDVSTQLWKALQARTQQIQEATEDDSIGRQCSDELLGKKNAFAPQLRHQEDGLSLPAELSREAKRQARDLLNSRIKIDQQAHAIRQGKTQTQQQRDDMRLRPTTTARPRNGDPGMTERLKKLREIQKRRDDVEQAREQEHVRHKQQEAAREKSRHLPTKTTIRDDTNPTTASVATTKVRPLVASASRTTKAVKPRRVVLEENTSTIVTTRGRDRHDDDRRTHKTNQHEVAGDPPRRGVSKPLKSSKPVGSDKPKLSTRDLRVLDEQIRHLQAENQQVVAWEEKLRNQQHLLLIKRRVWTIWQDCVERRRLQEASVGRGFEWRLLQRLWAAWWSHARAAKSHRVAQHTQAMLVREKQQLEMAMRFYRDRNLVVWFQQWRAVANAARDAMALETEIQKRREKAARLMQRFASAHNDSSVAEPSPVADALAQPPSPPQREPSRTKAVVQKPRAEKVQLKKSASERTVQRTKKEASPSQSPTQRDPTSKPTTGAPSPDAFYVSMQARAEQRKTQRHQLKQKYEQLEHDKREAHAARVAEREALLEKQKQDERDRIRDKRREDARLARDKETRRHVANVQQQSAALHDRLRLLFHYAWRPWQRAWLVSKRVARNATAWHELRVTHQMWRNWIRYVRTQRAQRHLHEQERMAVATDHYAQSLLRATIVAWRQALRGTQQKQLAVYRHVQWNKTRRAWRRWHHAYVLTVNVSQQREHHARRTLERRRLGVLLVGWRDIAAAAKRERMRQTEKELLWKKARMWLND